MGKKKNKQIIRPWCWYCEREFEDEKVLMQHQKAKHFKCNMCPRRLNTAGGLAVHIQQVHKLEPENLPRIENALPGRDGYEVEIFGMEGIPAPDVADYKRRKEIELGLSAGSITQPQAKRPKFENRALTEEELKAQLEAHKTLMGASEPSAAPPPSDANTSAVYGAPPQAYNVPPVPAPGPLPVPPAASQGLLPPAIPGLPGMPPPFFPGGPLPPGVPGQPPIPPFPGMAFPPMPPPGFPMPPGFPPLPGVLPPGVPVPPFLPGARPPIPAPPPTFVPASTSTISAGSPTSTPAPTQTPTPTLLSPPTGTPNTATDSAATAGVPSMPAQQTATFIAAPSSAAPTTSQVQKLPGPQLPNPSLFQKNPTFKKKTELKYDDANFSPEEKRAYSPRYYVAKSVPSAVDAESKTDAVATAPVEDTRGKKRARAEDFL